MTGGVMARLASEILQTARALLLLSFISRLFGAMGYGVWSQIGVTLGLFMPLVGLRLGAALVRYMAGLQSSTERSQAVFGSLAASLGLGCMVVILGVIARRWLSVAMFTDPNLTPYAILFLGLLVIRAAMSIALSYHHADSRIALHSSIQGGLTLLESLGMVLSAWVFRSSLETAILVVVVIDAVALLAVVADIVRRERVITVSPRMLLKLLRYSLPLAPAVALAWVVSVGDRYAIVHYIGLDASGMYAAVTRLAQVTHLVVQPILFVLFPVIARLWDQQGKKRAGKYLSDATRWYALLALPATAGLAAVGSFAVQVIAGGVFDASTLLIALLAFSELLVGISSIYILVLYLEEKTWIQPLLFLVIGAINLGLNLLWIPNLGTLGAAISTCLCRCLQVSVVLIIARRYVDTPIPWRLLAKVSVASVAVYLIAALIPLSGVSGLAIRCVSGVLTYAVLIMVLRVIRRFDLSWIRRWQVREP